MRSLLLFFLIYLLPSILSIIPSFFIVFNIGLVFMVLLLTGFHLISPHVLKQSPSKIPLHLSQIFLVVYLKVPSLAHFFSLFIQLLSALSSQRTQSSTTFMLMIPNCTFLLLLQTQLLHLKCLSNTFSDILSWMNSNKLLLNPSKTEFLLIGTKQQRLKFSQLTTLSLGNDIIPVSSSARNLGFIFDSDMSFTDQINSLSKSCHFHIRDIRRIRHLLPLSAATALANSHLVSSKLDYCNSLYNGISQANLNKIQRIQNTLARVVTNTSKFEHITPILKKLHWLPIKQRIDYKLCLLTYKTLQIQQPTYLYNSLSFPSHSLSTRSSDFIGFCPSHMSEHLWVKGPFLSLLQDSGTPSRLTPVTRYLFSTFRSKLKTHLFKLAFPPWILSHPIIGLPTRIWFLFFLYF